MSTAIKFDNISKQYRLGLVSTRTLSHDLNRWWQMNIRGKDDPYLKIGETNDRSVRGNSEYIWALRDINL
jgi:lipopolysaccharide transport system ATP-binding protein